MRVESNHSCIETQRNASHNNMIMMEVKNLCKTYGSTTAVDGLSFEVPDGKITGFLGANGAGKSTTMRCLLGLNNPSQGECTIDGVPFTAHREPASAVGAVLDSSWFHPGRSGRSHLRMVAASGDIRRDRVDEVLATVGLEGAADRKIQGYSLGMKQRLGLAAAILGNPRNLVLDEPVNGLDPQGVHWMRGMLRDVASSGAAVLVSSHLLSEIEMISDRVVVIGKGRLICESSTDDLLAKGSQRSAIRTTNDGRLRYALEAHGVDIERRGDELLITHDKNFPTARSVAELCRDLDVLILNFHEERANLEDLFLMLTDHKDGSTDRNSKQ